MIDPLLSHLMPPFCVRLKLRREAILSGAVTKAMRALGDKHQAMLAVASAFDTTLMEVEDACAKEQEDAAGERLARPPEAR